MHYPYWIRFIVRNRWYISINQILYQRKHIDSTMRFCKHPPSPKHDRMTSSEGKQNRTTIIWLAISSPRAMLPTTPIFMRALAHKWDHSLSLRVPIRLGALLWSFICLAVVARFVEPCSNKITIYNFCLLPLMTMSMSTGRLAPNIRIIWFDESCKTVIMSVLRNLSVMKKLLSISKSVSTLFEAQYSRLRKIMAKNTHS